MKTQLLIANKMRGWRKPVSVLHALSDEREELGVDAAAKWLAEHDTPRLQRRRAKREAKLDRELQLKRHRQSLRSPARGRPTPPPWTGK